MDIMSLLVTSEISEVVSATMLRQGVYIRANNPVSVFRHNSKVIMSPAKMD